MNNFLTNTALVLGFATVSLAANVSQANGVMDAENPRQKTEFGSRSLPKKPGLNEGVVEEVDKENRSIIINHGHIKSKTVEMGPMTMPFSVAKASLLNAVKAGDRIKFNVENVNDMPTITSLKVQK